MLQSEIVVIDDDESVRCGISAVLQHEGYSVLDFESRVDTLQHLLKLKPTVLITELVMTEVEGVELIRQLRNMVPQTRVIAMSGGARAHTYLQVAKLLGADLTLQKPVMAGDLLQAVRLVLAD